MLDYLSELLRIVEEVLNSSCVIRDSICLFIHIIQPTVDVEQCFFGSGESWLEPFIHADHLSSVGHHVDRVKIRTIWVLLTVL